MLDSRNLRLLFHSLGLVSLLYICDLMLTLRDVPVPTLSLEQWILSYPFSIIASILAGFLASRLWFALTAVLLSIALPVLQQTYFPRRL